MNELKWHFPTELPEAARLLGEPGAAAHAGGTGLLRTGVAGLHALVDLRRLPLAYIEAGADTIEVGAMVTYAEAASRLQALVPGCVLAESLKRAASTSLRNRITIGGGVAMAPPWSDLVGPLVALDAEVVLFDGETRVYPVAGYLQDRSLRKGKLVVAVRFRPAGWDSYYFRATETHFDYPSFTLAVLSKKGRDGTLTEARVALTGNKQRFTRLTALEEILIGRRPGDRVALPADLPSMGLDFSSKTIGSGDYVRQAARVEIERAFEYVLRVA